MSAPDPGRTDARVRGRLALVAGGSGGIGRAISQALVSAGARVLLVARDAERLAAAAALVGAGALPADVTRPEEVERLAGAVRRQYGDVPDLLINAMGAFMLAPLATTAVADFDRQLEANLRGPFLLIRTFLPAMLERGSGHIVTIGSAAGRCAWPGNGAYSASKFGVRGLHAVLDQELRGTGVRATLVEPSATDTPIWEAVDRTVWRGLPGRSAMLPPAEVAEAVLFALARPPGTRVSNLLIGAG
jgi:NAD(P)-dependent dehydrogenase (short-subunit alcohol dehydrogenase family)